MNNGLFSPPLDPRQVTSLPDMSVMYPQGGPQIQMPPEMPVGTPPPPSDTPYAVEVFYTGNPTIDKYIHSFIG